MDADRKVGEVEKSVAEIYMSLKEYNSSTSAAMVDVPLADDPPASIQASLHSPGTITGMFASQIASSLNHFVNLAIEDAESGKAGEGVSRLKQMLSFQRPEIGEDAAQKSKKIQDLSLISGKLVEILADRIGLPKPASQTQDSTKRDISDTPGNRAPTIILSGTAARIAVDVLPWLPDFNLDFVEKLSVFHGVALISSLVASLDSCTRNRAICSQSGLLGSLLNSMRVILLGEDDSASAEKPPSEAAELLDLKASKFELSSAMKCLEILAGFSIAVSEYQQWLSLISDCKNDSLSAALLQCMEKALRREDCRSPSHTFEFDGDSSGLLGPGDAKWPFSNGFAFASWIYVESFVETEGASVSAAAMAAAIAASASSKVGKSSAMSAAAAASALAGENLAYTPRLFSFVTAESSGIDLFFHRSFLVAEIQAQTGRKTSFHFTFTFHTQRWYFVGIEHATRTSILANEDSQIRLYVNGKLQETRHLDLPRITKPLSFCCIATNPPAAMAGLQRRRRQCPLFGEMGPVYIFKEPIGGDKMARLADRGGDYVPVFGATGGGVWKSTVEELSLAAEDSLLLDAELGPKIHLLYHPRLLSGRFCRDISPAGITANRRRPAEVLGQVHVAAHQRLEDAMWACGVSGPLSLVALLVADAPGSSLPLNLDTHPLQERSLALAPAVVRILSKAILHPLNLDEMVRAHSASLIAHLVRRLLSFSRTRAGRSLAPAAEAAVGGSGPAQEETAGARWQQEMLEALVTLAQASFQDSLKTDLYTLLLLDLKLWSLCSLTLQKWLLSQLADRAYAEPSVFHAADAVSMLLDGCRHCYWIEREAGCMEYRDGSRTLPEAKAMVEELVVLVELLLGSASGAQAATDMATIVNFCLACPQFHQVCRIMLLVHRLLIQPKRSRASALAENFVSCGGVDMMLHLLQAEALWGEGQAGTQADTRDDSLLIAVLQVLGSLLEEGQVRLEPLVSSVSSSKLDLVTAVLDPVQSLTQEKRAGASSLGLWLLYGLQCCFRSAPGRLMTPKLQATVMAIVTKQASSSGWEDSNGSEGASGEQLRHIPLLRPFLRQLHLAPLLVQKQAMLDLSRVISGHPDNRERFSDESDWLELLADVAVRNWVARHTGQCSAEDEAVCRDIHECVAALIEKIVLPWLKEEDGWREVERTFHSLDWLPAGQAVEDGEEAERKLPLRQAVVLKLKQSLFRALLHSASKQLSEQMQSLAMAAASAASSQFSPQLAKSMAEQAAQVPLRIAHNAISLVLLFENYLRTKAGVGAASSEASLAPDTPQTPSKSAMDGISLETLKLMADPAGQISASAMERITSSAAAKPFALVKSALPCYGSFSPHLQASWQTRSRMWYGVGLKSGSVSRMDRVGGAADGPRPAGLDAGDLELVCSAARIVEALTKEESGNGDYTKGRGVGILGMGGGVAKLGEASDSLSFALDCEAVYFAMLRLGLCKLREKDVQEGSSSQGDDSDFRLLWRIMAPLLYGGLSESLRDRVLATAAILFTEVYHSVSPEREIVLVRYVSQIVPPFSALLRKWRPLLASIPHFTDSEGQSPLSSEDRALAGDAYPHQAALSLLSPSWIACLASPPVAAALESVQKSTLAACDTLGLCLDPEAAGFSFFGTAMESTPGPQSEPRKFDLPGTPRTPAGPSGTDTTPFARQASSATPRRVSERKRTDDERNFRYRARQAMEAAWSRLLDSAGESAPVSRSSSMAQVSEAGFSSPVKSGLHQLGLGKAQQNLSLALDRVRTMAELEVQRGSICAAKEEMRLAVGARVWRSLMKKLLLSLSVQPAHGPSQPVVWKVDWMESSSRMRRRLKRMFRSSENQQYQMHMLQKGQQGQLADLQEISDSVSPFLKNGKPGSQESPEEDLPQEGLSDAGLSTPASAVREEEPAVPRVESSAAKQSAMATLTAESVAQDRKERMLLDVEASLVKPLKVVEGRLKVTSKRVIFLSSSHEGPLALGALEIDSDGPLNRMWPINSIVKLFSRRYLLRSTALEVFMADRSNCFFNFESPKDKEEAMRSILQAKPSRMAGMSASGAASQKPDRLFKRSQLCEKWVKREISNFEYLMELNTMAGRTFNDVTQYPVFPWVIADYSSEELDLRDSSVYRDLSKPVGALNPARLERILERYQSFDDPIIPKFHYGSHYSNAGSVLYYLVRLEPFSSLAVRLQGGTLDCADRLFSDLSSTWQGVNTDMSDVKELVPEFFYLPEMFENCNGMDLGRTQKGEQLQGVGLPPWALSASDFVHKNRMALESEYVSANLHSWIDLIFGYKQRGQAAIEAHNTFYYMTYEGAVDLDAIADPVLRKATQDQIAYFGQTPSQLLTSAHPRRIPLDQALHLQTVFRDPEATLKRFLLPEEASGTLPASRILVSKGHVTVVDFGTPNCQVALHRWQAHVKDTNGSPFLFQPGKASRGSHLSRVNSTLRSLLSSTEADSDSQAYPRVQSLSATGKMRQSQLSAISPDGRFIFLGGHIDNSVKVVSAETAAVLESAFVHCEPVTALAISSDGLSLVSGSRDCTVVLWKVRLPSVGGAAAESSSAAVESEQDPSLAAMATASGISSASKPSKQATSPSNLFAAFSSPLVTGSEAKDSGMEAMADSLLGKASAPRLEGPVHVLRGHSSEVTCVALCADVDTAASCSAASGILLHSLVKGSVLRRLQGPATLLPDLLQVSAEGLLAVWAAHSRCLAVFNLNGRLVAGVSLPPEDGNISAMEVSSDGMNLVVGTSMSSVMPAGSQGWAPQRGTSESLRNWRSDYLARSHAWLDGSAVLLLDLYTLQVLARFRMPDEGSVTALSLSADDNSLLCSTSSGQLLAFMDPTKCEKLSEYYGRMWLPMVGGGRS